VSVNLNQDQKAWKGISALYLGVLLLLLFFPPSILKLTSSTQEERYQALAKTLRCLVCQNQNLWESNTPIALDLKSHLKAQILAGVDDEVVRAQLIEEYGDFISYDPPYQGWTHLLWLGPLAFLSVCLYGLIKVDRLIKRDRRQ